jgi:hypothetical protein
MLNGYGEELSKSTSIVHVFIAETIMKLMNLHSIMSSLSQTVERILQAISYPPVESAIKGKVAVIGSDGCVRHMDVTIQENNLF